jgi:hypothetical protein
VCLLRVGEYCDFNEGSGIDGFRVCTPHKSCLEKFQILSTKSQINFKS